MVIANPIELTMVSAVPLDSPAAFLATSVENKGESATTINPQKIKKATSTSPDPWKNISGESRQHNPDRKSAVAAVLFAPHFKEIYPPTTQESPPRPIIKKESKGMLNSVPGCSRLKLPKINGTKAQKVYNSHICPKYLKAAALNCGFLKTFMNAKKSFTFCGLL